MAQERDDLLELMVRTYSLYYEEVSFWSKMDKIIGNRQNFTVLEVAGGPGLFIADFAVRYDVNELIASDYSDDMIRHTRNILDERGLAGKSRVMQIDFNSDEWIDGIDPIDVIFIGLSFRNIEKPRIFLNNVRRILSKTGIFIVYDFFRSSLERFQKQWFQYTKNKGPNDKDYDFMLQKYANFCRYSIADLFYLIGQSKFIKIYSEDLETLPSTILAAWEKEG